MGGAPDLPEAKRDKDNRGASKNDDTTDNNGDAHRHLLFQHLSSPAPVGFAVADVFFFLLGTEIHYLRGSEASCNGKPSALQGKKRDSCGDGGFEYRRAVRSIQYCPWED